MSRLERYAFWVTVIAVISAVHLLAGIEPNKSIDYLAKWGPFGDLLNPFITLVTTCFAYLAYKNTREQLINSKLQTIFDNYGKDLELLINGLIFKTPANVVFEGASALKHYRDFMGDLINNFKRSDLKDFTFDQMLEGKRPTYDTIYTEISRFKHLIEYYQALLVSSGVNEKTLEYFFEKIRLTLPLTIISCLGSMSFINNKANKHQDGLEDWLTKINLFKYHEKH